MLMAWGPFRFTIPNYAVETVRRSLQPRAEEQPVIGATPLIHRLGPGNEEITLESTFHPQHFNGRGLAQLAGVREAVNSLTPLHLVHLNGASQNIFGLWLATALSNEETFFDASGRPNLVSASLTLKRYDQSPARVAAMSLAIGGISLSAGIGVDGNFNASLRLGF